MKEATGEGSMTIITIVIIVALAAAAALIVSILMSRARETADSADSDVKVTLCDPGQTKDAAGNCVAKPAGS